MSNFLIEGLELKQRYKEIIEEKERNKSKGIEDVDLEIEYIEVYSKLNEIKRKIKEGSKAKGGITARQLKEEFANKPVKPHYATGIFELDDNLDGGIEPGTYCQLAGESGAGKTTLIMEILANTAMKKEAVLFSFEMGEQRILNRLDYKFTADKQWDNLIIDSDSKHINSIASEIKKYVDRGIYWFAIDSMMKIDSEFKNKDAIRHTELVSDTLSNLAHDNDIIILNINQMSEASIKNGHYDFKGNNAQKYDSDISLFLIKAQDDNRVLYCTKNRQNNNIFEVHIDID